MVSFVPLVARLPGAWFRPCFGWLAPGGGWFRLFFPPFLVWGGCGFRGSLLGCGLLAAVCCRGRFLLPSAHALSTWGQFMDKVMMERPGHSVCVGALFSPAARGGSGELAASCIWNGCSELGTFEHICWCCPYRPPDLDIPPNLTRASLLVMVGSSPIRELTSLLFKTGLFMCSACCGNLLILLLDGLACCLACCFVLLAFRRPLVFICSLHSLPGVRWFHSCLWWLGCLERGFVRASGGWLRVVVGSVWFSPLFGLGWLWFPRLSSGLRLPCCGLLRGQVTAPQRSCAVYLGAVHG